MGLTAIQSSLITLIPEFRKQGVLNLDELNKIRRELHISKTTYSRSMEVLKESGLVKKEEDGFYHWFQGENKYTNINDLRLALDHSNYVLNGFNALWFDDLITVNRKSIRTKYNIN